jgi:hypothetical protein
MTTVEDRKVARRKRNKFMLIFIYFVYTANSVISFFNYTCNLHVQMGLSILKGILIREKIKFQKRAKE